MAPKKPLQNPWLRAGKAPLRNPWLKPDIRTGRDAYSAQHLQNLEQQFKANIYDEVTAIPMQRMDFLQAMRRNQHNTWLLIGMMLLLTACFGYVLGWAWDFAFGGLMSAGMHYYSVQQEIDWVRLILTPSQSGIMVGSSLFAAMLVWTIVTLRRADKMVLRMTDAKDAPRDMVQLHNIVEEMSIAAGVPKPRVVIVPTQVPNAFATGLRQDKAVIGVTEGLLQHLNRRELQGVIAHEMAHVVNGDMRYATILAVMSGVLVFVAQLLMNARGVLYMGRYGNSRGRNGHALAMVVMLVVFMISAIVVPIVARLIQMAISRQREYLADATAVQLTRDPGSMIGALEKISSLQEPAPQMKEALEPLFIIPPVKMLQNSNRAWFSTHPPLQNRIARLKALE